MNSFKKLAALVLSLSLVFTSAAWVNAAQVSTKFNKTYTETFSDETKVFGDDGIFETVQNVTDDSVKVVSSNQGGKHLEITSGGMKYMFEQQYNATITFTTEPADVIGGDDSMFQFGNSAANNNSVEYVESAQGGTNLKVTSENNADVQITTKKGLLAYPVTIVDMSLRAGISDVFPQIKLMNNGAKFGNQSLFIFVDNTLRAYDIINGTHKATSSTNEWKDVRIIFNSVEQTITALNIPAI